VGEVPLPIAKLHQCLPSRIEVVSEVLAGIMRFIRFCTEDCCNAEEIEMDVEIALQEALTNAVVHGNQRDPAKRVHLTCRIAPGTDLYVTVRDEGEGFDRRTLPDPTNPQNLLLSHGRGIHLMKTLMDDVFFTHSGRVVRMRKRLLRLDDVRN
jgi:serine/threonine-protein kinase RsbW